MKDSSYERVLTLFIKGEYIDETTFFFADDPKEEAHFIGYLPQFEKPYWAGYCDIKDGCEFVSAVELFTAPIYNGRSIKDRYDQLVVLTIGGVPVEDITEW